jgi:hypothetical protein
MHKCDFNTHDQDFYTQSAIFTYRGRLSHTLVKFDTSEYGYHVHECEFDTQ